MTAVRHWRHTVVIAAVIALAVGLETGLLTNSCFLTVSEFDSPALNCNLVKLSTASGHAVIEISPDWPPESFATPSEHE